MVSAVTPRTFLYRIMISKELIFEDNRSGDGHDVIIWSKKRGNAEVESRVWSVDCYLFYWLLVNKKHRDGMADICQVCEHVWLGKSYG